MPTNVCFWRRHLRTVPVIRGARSTAWTVLLLVTRYPTAVAPHASFSGLLVKFRPLAPALDTTPAGHLQLSVSSQSSRAMQLLGGTGQTQQLHKAINSCVSPHKLLHSPARLHCAAPQAQPRACVVSSAAAMETAVSKAQSANNAPSDTARSVLFGTATEQVRSVESRSGVCLSASSAQQTASSDALQLAP